MCLLHDFLMTGLRDAVGKMADYQIILDAIGWHEKGVLTEDDLAELQMLMQPAEPVEVTSDDLIQN